MNYGFCPSLKLYSKLITVLDFIKCLVLHSDVIICNLWRLIYIYEFGSLYYLFQKYFVFVGETSLFPIFVTN